MTLRPSTLFIGALNKKDLVGVEIGVFEGEHALELLHNLSIKKLFLVDPYEAYDEFPDSDSKTLLRAKQTSYNRLAQFKSQIEFVYAQAAHVSNVIPDNLDFVYVDGNHAYKYVMLDLEAYWPKIRVPGGVFCGHDYAEKRWPDVAVAVNEFAKKNNLKINSEEQDWWVIKWNR